MKKAIAKNLKTWVLLSLAVFVGGTFTGCQEEVDQSNRFTFTGELISSHLENHPETFSHFVEILSKASIGKKAAGTMLKTLSTYGAYTCLAPTNTAIENYVDEQYGIYSNSVEMNKIDPIKYPIIETGVTSPNISDLSAEKCTEIARNHIIEDEFKTVDFVVGSALPKVTMNYRTVVVDSDIDPETGDRRYFLGINKAQVLSCDISTYNGTIHSLSKVLNPSTQNASEALNEAGGISIFRDALQATGLTALLNMYEIDKEYDNTLIGKTFDGQPNQKPAYPEEKNYGFTVLIEPNEVLANPDNNYFGMSINGWEDLAEFAERIYGSEPGYEKEYSHPKNALFKYVAYHIIDRKLDFVSGPMGWMMEQDYKGGNGFLAETNMSTNYNWHDYFETYLPYDEWEYTEDDLESISKGIVDEGCMIKVTKAYTDPEFKNSDIVLNYCNTTPSDIMAYHTNIKVIKQTDAVKEFPETMAEFAIDPQNAKIHLLNKILVYNEDEMRENIINERMRWDIISCFPELTTNRVRWNTDYPFVYIPAGGDNSNAEKQFCKRLRSIDNKGELFYLYPWTTGTEGYVNYQGDEFLAEGIFNIEYRLPHVPRGTYEVRIGFGMSSRRGVIQFYLDDMICGIPVDMRNDEANINRIGWFDDKDEDGNLLSEKEIQDSEKALRNRGYMKGPASIWVGNKTPMRNTKVAMRRILVTNQELTPTREGHWVRVKNVTEASTGAEEYNHDYLEIVPKSVYNNPSKPEDRN